MLTNINPLAGLAKLVIVLILVGMVIGVLLNNDGIFNTDLDRAKVRQLDTETEAYAWEKRIELEREEAITKAQTAAEVVRIQAQADAAYYLPYLLMGTGFSVVLILTTTFAIYVLMAQRSRLAIQEARVFHEHFGEKSTGAQPGKRVSSNGHNGQSSEEFYAEAIKGAHQKRRGA